MADTERTAATLLDELAALDPQQRRRVAKELRQVAEAFAEVPDGREIARALRLLAHLLGPTDRRRPVPQGVPGLARNHIGTESER